MVQEPDLTRAKAVCSALNSALFLAQFFLLKEETTGRYINVRFYDLQDMTLYPNATAVPSLAKVFDEFSQREFPPLRVQLDRNFDSRYKEFWSGRRSAQMSLFNVLRQPVDPSPIRLDFDLAVCKALDVPVTQEQLVEVYGTIVKEMIITRGLQRD